jgi:small basic protein
MWAIPFLIIAGFVTGYFLKIPFDLIGSKYLALIFIALLDSISYGLTRDLSGQKKNNLPIIIRLILGLSLGGFIIYFGEKSGIDLYLIALLPLAVGFSLNMYKFLPK